MYDFFYYYYYFFRPVYAKRKLYPLGRRVCVSVNVRLFNIVTFFVGLLLLEPNLHNYVVINLTDVLWQRMGRNGFVFVRALTNLLQY